jgi:hypothetical protein
MLDITPKPNWEQIRADYEAGAISIRQIAAHEGVSDTAIHKRAKAEGWNSGLRKSDEPALPGLQTPVQTTAQTDPATVLLRGTDGKVLAELNTGADDFKWQVGNPDIVAAGVPAVAVYLNPWDQVVIRQEGEYPEDDPFVRIDRRDVPALIKRLGQGSAAPAGSQAGG